MKRLKAHELLEKETIKASALRHKLANLPHKLKAELAGLYMHTLSNKIIHHSEIMHLAIVYITCSSSGICPRL